MKVHLTCSHPSRSLVLALQAARALLRPHGHDVSCGLPERWEDESGLHRMGLGSAGIEAADVVVHVCSDDEFELPTELTSALRFGKPVVRYEPYTAPADAAAHEAEATVRVTSGALLADAVAEACRLAIASPA